MDAAEELAERVADAERDVVSSVRRQLVHGHGRVPQGVIIGKGGNGNQGVVKKFVAARHEHHAVGDIAMSVGEFIRRETSAERERLRAHQLLSIKPRPEHEQDGGGHGSFVSDPAADADGEVEGSPIH